MKERRIADSKELRSFKDEKLKSKRHRKVFVKREKNAFNRKLRIKAILNERSTEFILLTLPVNYYTFFKLFLQFLSRRREPSSGIFKN